jgi:hypothetical protein
MLFCREVAIVSRRGAEFFEMELNERSEMIVDRTMKVEDHARITRTVLRARLGSAVS